MGKMISIADKIIPLFCAGVILGELQTADTELENLRRAGRELRFTSFFLSRVNNYFIQLNEKKPRN